MTSDAEEYAPSPTAWVRDEVDKVTEAGTTDVIDVRGLKVVLMTTRGAKSGKIRKSPLMRVEHDGEYLAVGSNSGGPKNPVGTTTSRPTRRSPSKTAKSPRITPPASSRARSTNRSGTAP
jgi:hypothetical protein